MNCSTEQWITQARQLFGREKPEHFTDYNHCDECYEHDQTLLQWDIDTISLQQLGNPGWDPLCFCSSAGKQYYMPALIRLTLASMQSDFYLEQLLFHLQIDGEDNDFYRSCNTEQRQFIADFLAHLVEKYSHQIEQMSCSDDLLQAHQIWSR